MKYTKHPTKKQAQDKKSGKQSFFYQNLLTWNSKDPDLDKLCGHSTKNWSRLLRDLIKRLSPSDLNTANYIIRSIQGRTIVSVSQARMAAELGYSSRPEQNKRLARLRPFFVDWARRYYPDGTSRTNVYRISPYLADPWIARELLDVFPDLISSLLILSEKDPGLKREILASEQYTHSFIYREIQEKDLYTFRKSYSEKYEEFLYRHSHPLLE